MSKREIPGNCQPDPSMSNDAVNNTGYSRTLSLFFPFIHIHKFLTFLLISTMPEPAPGQEDDREPLLRSTLLADSFSKGVACLCSEYFRYLRTVVQVRVGEGAGASELSGYIMQSLMPHVGEAAAERFRAALDYCKGKGVPRDMERRTAELREYFLKGLRVCRLSICSGGSKVMLPGADKLLFMDEWIRDYSGLAAALCAACRELFACVTRELPGLLRAYCKDKLPFCSAADAVDNAIDYLSRRELVGGHSLAVMCAIDRGGSLSSGKRTARKGGKKKVKEDLSQDTVLRCALGSRAETARGIIMLDVLLTSRIIKKQTGKKIRSTGMPVRDLLGERVCASEYVNRVVLDENPTLYQMLLRVDGMMVEALGYGIPGSFASDTVRWLEENDLADVRLADYLEPMRLKGKPDRETVAQMKAALTDEYITGLGEAVKVFIGKLRTRVKNGEKSLPDDDRGNDGK